jgi:hypothetical protein
MTDEKCTICREPESDGYHQVTGLEHSHPFTTGDRYAWCESGGCAEAYANAARLNSTAPIMKHIKEAHPWNW